MGNVLQIDAELKNIIVKNEINNCPLKIGDCILKINNKNITSYDNFNLLTSSLSNNEEVSILVRRNNSIIALKCKTELLKKICFNNFISGFATLTYINPDTNEFGAIGHSININNNRKIPIKEGCISFTNNINIKKSSKGNVGCINGTKNIVVGDFKTNDTFGIKGKVNNINISNKKKYKIASFDEIKLGNAQIILQNKNNICKKYDIEIINIENQKKPDSKGIKIKIIDPELIRETGGIVQGMSGTPIVQDDKIIGAVSHALESNPQIGYGVYIKWMIESN